jgi:hypothetical protein
MFFIPFSYNHYQDKLMKIFLDNLSSRLPEKSQAFARSVSLKSERFLYIEDNESSGKTVFVTQDVPEEYLKDKCFKIVNNASKDIVLWAIDGSFVPRRQPLSEKYPRKCDCAFGFDNFIGFVEFKLNAISISDKAVLRNKEDACDQLGQTINFVRDTLGLTDFLRIEGYIFEAYMCTPQIYPRQRAQDRTLAVSFALEHRIGLFEVSEKEC